MNHEHAERVSTRYEGLMYNSAQRINTLFGLLPAAMLALCFSTAVSGQGPTVTFSTLYSFGFRPDGTGSANGDLPTGTLYVDRANNIYGVTNQGGAGSCERGCGLVFRIDTTGKESTLYRFQGGADGGYPVSNLVPDAHGNLYGVTSGSGDLNCTIRAGTGRNLENGCGVIFKLDASGSESAFYTFHGPDGKEPLANLIRDGEGNIYSTTYYGGPANEGVVFEVDKTGNESVVYAFSGAPGDGSLPYDSALFRDSSGNLFGVTLSGGGSDSCYSGCGVVFRISPSGTETILHAFTDSPDGSLPLSPLIEDQAGNLYGATTSGGAYGGGTIFQIDPGGNETIFYSFPGYPGPSYPAGNLIRDRAGNLYGTYQSGFGAGAGGSGGGGIFRLDPAGNLITLHQFKGDDGALPEGLVARKVSDGVYEMYGVTLEGGPYIDGGSYFGGTVYKLTLTAAAEFEVE